MSLGLVLAGALTLVGCASQPGVPRDPADVPGYRNPPPDLAGIDPTPLTGRRILIDPGHGGHFRGAVGDGGLTEAEVNLGVALYLQGLLQWAGAEVHLTRTADVDFLSPADSTLTADLAARVAVCDSLMPDVFLSIHHNSTASRDPDINETQTYYPLGREGADRDLARAIHGRLVRALSIEPAKILPGGFYVLRHAPVPAVLGEPAMISNPVIEGRLTQARSLELEASAYFLGLRDYFAGGMPRWLTAWPDTASFDFPDTAATWIFDSGAAGAPGLDPASLAVSLDGVPLALDIAPDGQRIDVAIPAAGAGRRLVVHGRNLAGRAAPDRVHELPDPGVASAWPVVTRRGDPPVWLEAAGAFPLLLEPTAAISPPDPAAALPDTIIWESLLPSLVGRRIAIDPRGGGGDDEGTGPLGTRGSDLNLRVAERLATLLRGAGSEVTLVRTGEIWTPDPERVRRADDFAADLYLAIGRGTPTILFHHGSAVGTPWAAACAAAITPLLSDTVTATPAYDYVLRHTACPAIMVHLAAATTVAAEHRLTTVAWQDAVARAIFRGTVALLEPAAEFLDIARSVSLLGPTALPPARLDLVRLDGNFLWLPPSGQSVPTPVPSWGADDPGLPILGDHHVLELRAGPHWQLWTLSRLPAGDWHGRLFLENR